MQSHPSELIQHGIEREQIVRQLRGFLAEDEILLQDEDLRPYECDGLSAYQRRPWLVVIPRTSAQVQKILQTCSTLGVPVVARGAGTGLSGGALPLENGVLLSMARFDRILDIDPLRRTARVGPGVRNLAISEAVSQHGLYYAPDPSSQIACTIGGNVAENSGGVHCLKYGLTVHNILQVDMITMQGECLTIGSQCLDTPGYDLLALLTGSEGLLGVITEVTVRLLPKPHSARVLMASFERIEQAGEAVAAVIAAGIIPAGMEMMDNASIRAAEDFVHAGYPVDAAAILLCELDGDETAIADEFEKINAIMLDHGATDIHLSASDQERQRMWAGRKAAFPAVGRISPDYYCMDGTIPRKRLGVVLQRINELSAQYGLRVANVFHAGDGNLHPLILYDANNAGELETAEEMGGKILELCVENGGTITGEHGVGIEKINQMCFQFNPQELQQFHAIKHAFDPAGLLNPGKAVPTLHRCAEFGGLHVHHGNLPFPDLERF
jgi:glycolate oxidase